jgi:hypothetical protein
MSPDRRYDFHGRKLIAFVPITENFQRLPDHEGESLDQGTAWPFLRGLPDEQIE